MIPVNDLQLRIGKTHILTLVRRWSCAAVMLLMPACVPDKLNQDSLRGEWKIRLYPDSTGLNGGTRSDTTTGAIVFDPRIPEHSGEPAVVLNPPYEVGRAYLDIGPLWGLRPGRSVYGSSKMSDVFEEVIATARDSVFSMIISPRVTGGNIRFSGTMHGDSATGSFVQPSHPGPPLTGHFRMWRVRPGPATDSARIRSERSASRFSQVI